MPIYTVVRCPKKGIGKDIIMSNKIEYIPVKNTERVPARMCTPEELNVIVEARGNQSTNPNVPVGNVVFQLPWGTGRATLFMKEGILSASFSKDYISCSIPADLQSAILDRVDVIWNRENPIYLAQENAVTFVPFKNANPERGYLAVRTATDGRISGFKYGLSKAGKPYLMMPEIFVASNKDAKPVALEADTYIDGKFKVTNEEGVMSVTRADVRTGGVTINPALYNYLLECVTARVCGTGAGLQINANVNTADVEADTVEDDETVPVV